MEDEIDLRKYLRMLVKRWRLIRDVVIVAVVSALAFGALQPTEYEAKAGVAIVRTRSQLELDPKFKTLSAEQLPGVDMAARRNTLAALVKNPAVAQEVIKELGAQLPPAWQRPEQLMAAVEGGVARGGDLIEIRVRGSDPSLLTTVANSWAAAYERYINRIYATGGGSASSLEKELAAAKAQYERASADLIEFTGHNRIDELTRLVEERKKTIENLEKGKQQALAQYITTTLTSGFSPLVKEAEARSRMLGELYAARVKVQLLLEDARALRSQVEGGSDPGNQLALLLLKAQAFGSSADLPGNLQLQLGALPSTSDPADVDALIRVLERRLGELDAAIAQQASPPLQSRPASATGSSGNPGGIAQFKEVGVAIKDLSDPNSALSQTIARLNEEVLEFEKELARQKATKEELTRARDLAWETYSTLARKVEEARIAAAVPGTEVTFALPAGRPTEPLSSSRRSMTGGLAAALGLILGVFGAFALEYLAPEAPTPAIPWAAPPRWVWRRLREASPPLTAPQEH